MMINKERAWVTTGIMVAALLILATTQPQKLQAQGFWADVDVYFQGGVNNFHGQYDNVFGGEYSRSEQFNGLPYPIEGGNLSLGFSRPMIIQDNFNLRLRAAFDFVRYRSSAITGTPNQALPAQNIIPVNIINNAFGPAFGVSFEVWMTENWAIEPSVDFAIQYHNPRTDNLFDVSDNNVIPREDLVDYMGGTSPGDAPFSLRNFTSAQSDIRGDEIPSFIPSMSPGLRITRNLLGNYNWYFQYNYQIFLNDTFDGHHYPDVISDGPSPNAMSRLSTGISFPIDRAARQEAEELRVEGQAGTEEFLRMERIENIANLIRTEEDLRELQSMMSDKILLHETPGVRFNEKAAQAVEQSVALGDSEFMTEMIELPGGSYIMGLNSVDDLDIQVQGRKRITVNPFMIDKYAVTNEQYRAFLIAMEALPSTEEHEELMEEGLFEIDENTDYGTPIEWDELLEEAEIEDYNEHVAPPSLDGPEDLLPNNEQWNAFGLDDVVPWETYFYDSFYDNYPVVAVNWYQAKLFAAWADKRLPKESEWEYAARSGVSGRIYPWDGLDIQTNTGQYRANYMQERGVYDKDGYAIMAPVDAFMPNDFGLYNMAGNVSEWVLDSYNPSYVVLESVGTANFVSPSYLNHDEPRKVHRGGSWQSTEFFLGVGVRNFQHKNQSNPMIGFRAANSVSQRYGDDF